jgi:protocatechuate 3,4-dioxygenase beta subunit
MDTGRPLRRARVSLTLPDFPINRNASTNTDGRYEFTDLPAGRYTLRVNRSGYLPLAHGQKRPGEMGKPLELTDKQTAERIDFALPRVGVITGRIVDEYGEPMANVNLWTLESQYYQGARRLATISTMGGHTSTDDSGRYRLIGLPPGEYAVMAQTRETWNGEKNPDEQYAYAQTYYPGTTMPAEAGRIKVGTGQEIANIDFALVVGRTAKVSGLVTTAAGLPVEGEEVSLYFEVGGPEMKAVFPSTNRAITGPDGTFELKDVLNGEYLISARARAASDRPGEEVHRMIVVNGDMTGLTLVTGASGVLRGIVVTDDDSPLPANLEQLLVRPVFTSVPPLWRPNPLQLGRVNKDASFETGGLFGERMFTVQGLTGDWTLKRIEYGNRSLADDPIEFLHGETIAGVRVVLTKHSTRLRGRLLDEKQEPAEGAVVVFAEDRARWRENSRWVRSARPDQRGEYSFKGLPAGAYLIAALDYVKDGDWQDPEFLDGLRKGATRVVLADAEDKRIDLVLLR